MTRRVKDTLVSLVLVVLFFGGLISSPKIRAQSLEELRKQREQLSRDILRNQQGAEFKRKEAQALAEQLKKIDADIAATQSRIEATQAQINDTQAAIDVLNAKIAEKQKQLTQAVDRQNEAIRVIYETTDQNIVLLALGSSFSDAVDRASYLEALELSIEKIIAEIKTLQEELKNQKTDQQSQLGKLEKLKLSHEAYEQGLETQKDRKNNLLGTTKKVQKEFELKLADAIELRKQTERQIDTLARQAGLSGGRIKAKDKGTSAVGFIWPIDYDDTTTEFGPTNSSYPFYPAILEHKGLDIVNPICGTPAYASADGVANLFSGNAGYGKYIVVGHNERFSTLYGHLQGFAVSDGEEVKQGDTIGFEGTTGLSTGCHLHFEVWEHGERKNPRLFLP